MKIRLSELRQIIREELKQMLEENWGMPDSADARYRYWDENEEEQTEFSPRRWDGQDHITLYDNEPSKK